MTARWAVLAGHAIEVLGVFLLSVEAIKLENFCRLRDKLLLPLSHNLKFTMKNFLGREEGDKIIWSQSDLAEFRTVLRRWVVFHLGAGWLALSSGLLLAVRVSDGAMGFVHRLFIKAGAFPLVLVLLGAILVTLLLLLFTVESSTNIPPPLTMFFLSFMTILNPLLLAGMVLGEASHLTIDWLLKGTLRALRFIDARTPDGTIGILGFALVLLGTLLQLFAGGEGHADVAG